MLGKIIRQPSIQLCNAKEGGLQEPQLQMDAIKAQNKYSLSTVIKQKDEMCHVAPTHTNARKSGVPHGRLREIKWAIFHYGRETKT